MSVQSLAFAPKSAPILPRHLFRALRSLRLGFFRA